MEEYAPASIVDTLGKMPILDHVADFEVFIGNQIVRCDERVRCFPSEILTLPSDFQIRLSEFLTGFLAIATLLLFTGYLAMKPFQFLLSLPKKPWIVYGVPIGVGEEGLETHINSDLFPCRDMFYLAISFDSKLDVVTISTSHEAHPFDLCGGEGYNLLIRIANKTQTANPTAIGEGDVFSVSIQLPSSDFVFHASVIVLKLRIAFLPANHALSAAACLA
jgi:hypothetical protein